MKKRLEPNLFPQYLQLVFREVGKAMGGRRLHPEVLADLPAKLGELLADHTVRVEHRRGAAAGPKGNHYTITIEGPRLAGYWTFWSGELEQLARSSLGTAD